MGMIIERCWDYLFGPEVVDGVVATADPPPNIPGHIHWQGANQALAHITHKLRYRMIHFT